MKKMCKYLCLEGVEGSFKSTNAAKLAEYLSSKGYKVLLTREPGSPLSPLTMELRKVMLDSKYESQMTIPAREFISQAIRSIHLKNVIIPALSTHDFIVQDRGILSGLAYGYACGNELLFLTQLIGEVVKQVDNKPYYKLYDKVVYLRNDAAKGLALAKSSKQEFEAGDAMEAKGVSFLEKVSCNMSEMLPAFPHCVIDVEGKSQQEVFQEILKNLGV